MFPLHGFTTGLEVPEMDPGLIACNQMEQKASWMCNTIQAACDLKQRSGVDISGNPSRPNVRHNQILTDDGHNTSKRNSNFSTNSIDCNQPIRHNQVLDLDHSSLISGM